MRYSLYESPHLLLLQGYSQQHVSHPPQPRRPELTERPPGVVAADGLLAVSCVSWELLRLRALGC